MLNDVCKILRIIKNPRDIKSSPNSKGESDTTHILTEGENPRQATFINESNFFIK